MIEELKARGELQLAALLLTGGVQGTVIFKKGEGIVRLVVENLRAGRCAALEWLRTSRQLELMT